MADNVPWRNWARLLERFRPQGGTWAGGALPDSDLVYLFADGFHSDSTKHWLATVEQRLQSEGCRGAACGFSYAGLGLPYSAEHTRVTLYQTLVCFRNYLEAARNDQELVLIGFSLGAVVTVLGLREWLEDPNRPARKIRAVIVIAPAHAVSPHLQDSYQMWVDDTEGGRLAQEQTNQHQRRSRRTIPQVVLQYVTPHSPHRRRALESFSVIVRNNIPLHVLYWENDMFTPFEFPNDLPKTLLFQKTAVRDGDAGRGLEFAVSEHMQVRDHRSTEDTLVSILQRL